MRRRSTHHQSGVTLIEVLIAAGLLVLCAGILINGTRVVNYFTKSNRRYEIRRDAQVAVYQIIRDIRNSKTISHVAWNQLVLPMWDTSHGFDPTAPDSHNFQEQFVSTITYTYKEKGDRRYLEKWIDFPAPQMDTYEKLLLNCLNPPSPTAPLFIELETKNAVSVNLSLHYPFDKNTDSEVYTKSIFKRSVGD